LLRLMYHTGAVYLQLRYEEQTLRWQWITTQSDG